jgi:tRNA(Ile)-lysidine synthase
VEERGLDAAGGNLEETAREARLEFFTRVIESGQVRCVATGHTRSDQAETVLFRFLRGAGTAGLAGIRPVTSTGLVRPLLEVSREDVLAHLRERGIAWREDSTNQEVRFDRNRIRQELLPQLSRDWNPGLPLMLAQVADWALAEESYWEAEITRLAETHLEAHGDGILLGTKALRKLPLAAARRLVRAAMERVKGDLRGIDFIHVRAVVEMAAATEGHGRFQAPGLDIMRSFEWLRFGRPVINGLATRNYRLAVAVPGILRIPGTELEICLELTENSKDWDTGDSVYNVEMGGVDWRRLSGPLELRNWRPGDQYQPQGTAGPEKIKTLFQESRVPLWERRHWPVLTDGTSIVWARRFGPAAEFAAGQGSPIVLRIRERRIGAGQNGVYRSNE